MSEPDVMPAYAEECACHNVLISWVQIAPLTQVSPSDMTLIMISKPLGNSFCIFCIAGEDFPATLVFALAGAEVEEDAPPPDGPLAEAEPDGPEDPFPKVMAAESGMA